MPPQAAEPVELFYSYSHKDEKLRGELVKHLSILKRRGVISSWSDREIGAGEEWRGAIDEHLNSAGIILLLISADFIDSDYCYDIEMTRAMERHKSGEARVIPIFLRQVNWKGAPFGELQALPTDTKPVSSWDDPDEAFTIVSDGIQKAVEKLIAARSSQETSSPIVAPLPALSPQIPNNRIVDFVERRDRDGRNIVERLTKELAPQESRLIVLWGAGGVGKTTLAAEAVRALIEAYAQRILWIDAEKRTDFVFATLLDDIATQLGRADLRPLALAQKQEEVGALIAAAPTLVVLDNFETIKEEEQARCAEWLKHRPALVITREGVAGVTNIPIDPMSLTEARTLVDKLVSQARDQRAFAGLNRDRVIRTAESNPLVLQWIIAQIDLAQDPDEVLDELARGEGTAAQRVFNRSFDLPQLADGGRAVLLALSLFVPSASRPMLAEVAGMSLSKDKDKKRFKEATKRLASLWLVRVDEGRLTVEGLTREFAKARLSADTRSKTFRTRFVERFLRYAEANADMNAGDFNALETERDNILKAMDVSFEMKDWGKVVGIRSALEYFLDVHGYWDEAIRRGEQAIEAALQIKEEVDVAVLTGNIARIRSSRGEYDEARQTYQRALETFRKTGYQMGIAAALGNIAAVEQSQGNSTQAQLLCNESLTINRSLGNQHGIASNLLNLGSLAEQQGDLLEARKSYDESFVIRKNLNDQKAIASILECFASLALIQGNLEEGEQLNYEALELRRKLGHQSGIASSLGSLGLITQDQGMFVEARQLYEESLDIQKKLGDQSGIAINLHNLGRVAQDQTDFVEARRLYNKSLEIHKNLGSPLGIAGTMHQLGTLSLVDGDLPEAENLLQQSLAILKKLGHKQYIGECLESFGNLRVAQERLPEAADFFDESLEIAKALPQPLRIGSVHYSRGLLAEKQGDAAEAVRLFRDALVILEKLGSFKAEKVWRDLARVTVKPLEA